ncbi:major facilitator superfamily domain-containing protein [Suillus paluster]|uniref:major facilitator superfamily domain-containing protein n=1 Tax=Suillus paluster TaxID=48578 RepID=UPI001B868218|nr:major facilitator superfamily domain-containing protein [Suillus paluster]KAG1735317.1 major facilitator superfamily domain-containing protein [Suillus paluster]
MSKPELTLTRSPSHDPNFEKGKHHVVQCSLLRSIFIVVTCTAAMVVNTSNAASVSISLPTIEKDLDIDEEQLQWLVSSYSLSSGCLLLFFGRLADLYGRKKAFMIGTLCQVAFSLGCGFAQNGLTLAVLCGFLGIGTAATIPSALGILAHSFPPSRARSIAFATFSAGAPVGGAFGMMIGGVLTEFSSTHWSSVFYLTAGISALTGLTGMISFDADVPSTEIVKRVDWIGALLITVGLVLIVFVLGQGELASQGWKTPYIIALLIAGVIMVSLFLLWERYLEQVQDDPSRAPSAWMPPPLMRPSIWTRARGRMAVILVIAFLNWSAFMSWCFWVQLYYQNYLLLPPVKTMIRFIPMFIVGCLCNIFVAMVVARLPLVVFVVSGTLLTASAGILFALIDPSATYWAFGFPSTVLVVFGADFVYSSGTIFIAKIALHHEQSVAGALFQTMTQLGIAFGLTITTIVFNTVVKKESADPGVTVNSAGTNTPQSAQLKGYKSAQWTSASFALIAALLAVLFLRSVGIVGDKKTIKHTDSDQTKMYYARRCLDSGIAVYPTSKQGPTGNTRRNFTPLVKSTVDRFR